MLGWLTPGWFIARALYVWCFFNFFWCFQLQNIEASHSPKVSKSYMAVKHGYPKELILVKKNEKSRRPQDAVRFGSQSLTFNISCLLRLRLGKMHKTSPTPCSNLFPHKTSKKSKEYVRHHQTNYGSLKKKTNLPCTPPPSPPNQRKKASKINGSLVPCGSDKTTGNARPTIEMTLPMPCLEQRRSLTYVWYGPFFCCAA